MESRWTIGAIASKNESASSLVSARIASASAGEVSGPVAMMVEDHGGRPSISSRRISILGCAASASVTAAEKPSRSTASALLARSGRLNQIIDRANEELKKAPNAVPIHQALADYYTAARQPVKARAELIRVAELRPEDVNLRLQVAGQLAGEGQAEAAPGLGLAVGTGADAWRLQAPGLGLCGRHGCLPC